MGMSNYTINAISQAKSLAIAASQSSSCLKKKVGCAILDMDTMRVISVGHGGAAIPCETCIRKTKEWQQDGCWSIHSEVRALFNLFERGVKPTHDMGKHWIAIVTHGPCDQCLKYLNYYGVPLVLYDIEYHNDYSKWEGKIRVHSIQEAIDGGVDLSII